MAWDDIKVDGISTLPAIEWNTHVNDQKARAIPVTTFSQPSHVNGTIYQNTRGNPMWIFISEIADSATAAIELLCDSVTPPIRRMSTMSAGGAQYAVMLTGLIPYGYYYKVNVLSGAFTVDKWTEAP